ncbi:DUF7408 domain-containing protein [Brevibacillus migulae]|uniref:DUF7408 domain-containing protein n=1 Tax=Brevibacillus migulae TaxID=1644114 RepID=UPI00106EB9B0|nr:hypothetical protein [Brevibacillus migulae]
MNMYRSMQVVRIMLACLCLFSGLELSKPMKAEAQGLIKMEVQAGIGGDYKEADLIPMQITVSNQGEDVSGEIVIASPDNDILTASYFQPLAISKGTTKKVSMLVPGRNLNTNDVVQFIKDGKELARATITGHRFDPDSFFVGVLAADPDTANFLGTLPRNAFSRQIRMVALNEEVIPTESLSLGMLDMIVINNYAMDRMQPEQIRAINEWVHRGGILVLAGGSQYDKGAGVFQDISPVRVDGAATIAAISSFAKGERKPIVFTQPFTVSRGQLVNGQVLYQESGLPLLAYQEVQQGKVLYVAYDLIEEPVASWSGNSSLWSEVLQKVHGKADPMETVDTAHQYWPLLNAAERIPTLTAPSVSWLAILFGIYALVAGPILFIVLRDKKKRPFIWGIVPALAIVMCATIYLFGIAQRGTNVLMHNVSYVELDTSGRAEAVTSSAMFVPTGGDYAITSPQSELLVPVHRRYRGNDEKLMQNTWVNTSAAQREIRFLDVEHWSIRSLLTQKVVPDAGTLGSDLMYQDGKLVGTVTNQTKYSLRDVKIANGGLIQDLGTLKPGQTVKVNVGSDPNRRLNRDSYLYMKALLPEQVKKQQDPESSREYSALEMLERKNRLTLNQPVRIFGWTEEPIVQLDVKEEETKTYDLALVTTALQVKPSPNGYVLYPQGTFTPVMISNSTSTEDVGNGFIMDEGDIQLELDTRKDKNQPFAVTKIQIYTWSDDNTTFKKQVYNWQTKKFDEFEKAFVNNTMTEDKVKTYLSPEGKLRLSFSHQYQERRHLGYPEISVEGRLMQK